MRNKHPRIGLVIPTFNEEENTLWYYEKIAAFMQAQKYDFNVLYVDDGSTDSSLSVIKDLASKHSNVGFISLSRNFGKEIALTAGLGRAKGDVVIAVDADGQYPLDTIPAFIQAWQNGADIVVGVRNANPGHNFVQGLGSRMFYRFLRMLDSGQEVVAGSTDFRLLDKRVVREFSKLTERNRVTRNLIDWLGFKRAYVPFSALERHGGVATYSFKKRLKLALDGMIKHSTKPLKFIGGIGMLISILSVSAALFLGIESYVLGDPLHLSITGTAILALLLSFLIGVVLVCQGLLALYLENVYHETQNRPLYVVAEESDA